MVHSQWWHGWDVPHVHQLGLAWHCISNGDPARTHSIESAQQTGGKKRSIELHLPGLLLPLEADEQRVSRG